MDNGLNWDCNILINELTQGKENAYKLKFHLLSTTPNEAHDLLLQRIVSSYDKALTMILKWYRSDHIRTGSAEPSLGAGANESSITLNEEFNTSFKHSQENNSTSKKRKLTPAWTQRVKVNNGVEGPTDDGCSWRKYGQKDILGAKYPRSYYRCTYKFLQNCSASKQVQRSDEDPTVFDITYKGTHTCGQSKYASVPQQPLASSEENETEENSYINQTQEHNRTLANLKENLIVSTKNLVKNENNATPVQFSFPGQDRSESACYFPIFASSATSESDCYIPTAYKTMGFDFRQSGISDISEITSSTHASTTNSPIAGIAIDPDLLFENMGFFS